MQKDVVIGAPKSIPATNVVNQCCMSPWQPSSNTPFFPSPLPGHLCETHAPPPPLVTDKRGWKPKGSVEATASNSGQAKSSIQITIFLRAKVKILETRNWHQNEVTKMEIHLASRSMFLRNFACDNFFTIMWDWCLNIMILFTPYNKFISTTMGCKRGTDGVTLSPSGSFVLEPPLLAAEKNKYAHTTTAIDRHRRSRSEGPSFSGLKRNTSFLLG